MRISRTTLLALALVMSLAALGGVSTPDAHASCPGDPCKTDSDCLAYCCARGFCPYIPPDEGPVCHHNPLTTCTRCYC